MNTFTFLGIKAYKNYNTIVIEFNDENFKKINEEYITKNIVKIENKDYIIELVLVRDKIIEVILKEIKITRDKK